MVTEVLHRGAINKRQQNLQEEKGIRWKEEESGERIVETSEKQHSSEYSF